MFQLAVFISANISYRRQRYQMDNVLIAVSNKENMERLFDKTVSLIPPSLIQVISMVRKRISLKNGNQYRFIYVPEDFNQMGLCGLGIDTLYVDEGVIKNESAFKELRLCVHNSHKDNAVRILSEMYDIDAGMILRGI